MEVGAEQHQGGGEGRACPQLPGLTPGHRSGPLGLEHQQGGGGGTGTEGQPAERFPQAPVAKPERRPLIHIPEAAAEQNKPEHSGAARPGEADHQDQPQPQRDQRPLGHPIASTREIHHGMGLTRGINTGFGIKQIVAEVLPQQQQDGRQQEAQQLAPTQRSRPSELRSRRQQHRHHGHRVHRPLDRRLPQLAPIGVTGCDSLRLWHGRGRFQSGDVPYI